MKAFLARVLNRLEGGVLFSSISFGLTYWTVIEGLIGDTVGVSKSGVSCLFLERLDRFLKLFSLERDIFLVFEILRFLVSTKG